MRRSLIGAGFVAVALAVALDAADSGTVKSERHGRIHFGGISFGAGAGYGPLFFDPYYYGGYEPFFFPGYFGSFQRGPSMGEVKLHSRVREADVYLNRGYAGEIRKLKDIWLNPGSYELRVTAENRPPFEKKIYVLGGKTLRIDVELGAELGAGVKP